MFDEIHSEIIHVEILWEGFFDKKFPLFNRYRAIYLFLFYLVSVLETCISQGMRPVCLSCLWCSYLPF